MICDIIIFKLHCCFEMLPDEMMQLRQDSTNILLHRWMLCCKDGLIKIFDLNLKRTVRKGDDLEVHCPVDA
jgi:hypothetical protein